MSGTSIRPRSIRFCILLVFLVLTVSVGMAGRVYYERQKESLKQSTHNELAAIVDLKVRLISWWIKERMDDATLIFETPFIADQIDKWIQNKSDYEIKSDILSWMESLKAGYDYSSVALLDNEWTVLLSIYDGEMIIPELLLNSYKTINRQEPSLLDLQRSETDDKVHMSFIVPLISHGPNGIARPVATLSLMIDPYQYLYPIVESWPSLSPSSETILLRREGPEALCLSELRHRKNTALSFRLPMSDPKQVTTMAASGVEGVVEGLDYRGIPVMAAIRSIPDSSWRIIVKFDTEEIYGPFRRYAWILGFFVFLFITGAGVSVTLIWRRVEEHNAELGRLNTQLEHEIEERKQARKALWMSEEKYRGLVEGANSIIIRLDTEGRIVFLNKFGQTFFGYTEQEILGQEAIGTIIPETDSSGRSLARIYEEIISNPSPYSVHENENTCRNGERVWIAWSNRVIYDDEGHLSGILGIGTDVTDRKRAEDALRRNAKLLHILHGIGQSILEVRSPAETVREAIHRICELVPWQGTSVGVFDFEAKEILLIVGSADSTCRMEEERRLPLEPLSTIIDIIREGEWYEVEGISTTSVKSEALHSLQPQDMSSFVCVPLSFRNELIGSFNLWNRTPVPLTEEHRSIISEVANLLAVAIQNARLFESIKEQYKQLRSLITRLADVEETERRRIARELHDRVGQNLTALNINLSLLSGLLPAEVMEKASVRLEDAQSLVEETVRSIRDVMVELRPPDLDEFGLGQSLDSYVEKFSERTDIAALVQYDGLSRRLPPSVEIALFRIAQEALTNVVRHSRATRVVIRLDPLNGGARMTITDNGAGFSIGAFAHPGERKPGWGLLGMRERAEAVSGKLRIESAPGKGTSVIVEVGR